MGVNEVWIDFERFAILRNRVVVPSHLQQQLCIGVIRIWIFGNQFDVFFERLFRVRIVNILPVGVAENVPGGLVFGIQVGGLFVVFDGLRIVLLPEVIATKIKVRPLIVRVGSN